MGNLSYIIIFFLALELLIIVAIYAYKHRQVIDEMHGMMIGMTLGMFSGLITATLFLIPTGNFLYGVILGSIIGLLFGMPLGRLGGHLGVMEGVMAGPMGGMMGAMLGQMIRPFSIEIFMPFFMFIVLLTMIGITYAVQCKANFVNNPQAKEENYKVSDKFVMSWVLPVIFLLVLSVLLPFKVGGSTSSSSLFSSSSKNSTVAIKGTNKAVVNGNVQEVGLEVNDSGGYTPSTIYAKEGIPLKIHFSANGNSCAQEIVFPELNIDEFAPAKGTKTITIESPVKGTYIFRCPMDMARGKLIVK